MSNITDFQIDFETFEALAQDGEWSSFPETGELGLDAALDYAARQAATAVQQDDRFGGMDPEAGWDLIVPGTDWAYAAKDRRVRERALEALRYDRQHKGW